MLIAQRPSLTEEVVDEYRSRFVIEPLEPGFGYTLGNSLRRTLLSSIPGAAVTSIRVDGVLHEFTTVPGVKEDVTDLILNIKQLVVEADKQKTVLISTLVLVDGVERVGKTGIAVELSANGRRTGIVYLMQCKDEKSATSLFDGLLAGSDRYGVA